MPSGWYHEVENLEPTLSINHNWTNGFGLLAMWTFLASELAAVRAALADCRESFAPGGWARPPPYPYPYPYPNP